MWLPASSERQPPMYFPLGGGTLKGISKPGSVVWSRIYIEDGRLKCDLGSASSYDKRDFSTESRSRSSGVSHGGSFVRRWGRAFVLGAAQTPRKLDA